MALPRSLLTSGPQVCTTTCRNVKTRCRKCQIGGVNRLAVRGCIATRMQWGFVPRTAGTRRRMGPGHRAQRLHPALLSRHPQPLACRLRFVRIQKRVATDQLLLRHFQGTPVERPGPSLRIVEDSNQRLGTSGSRQGAQRREVVAPKTVGTMIRSSPPATSSAFIITRAILPLPSAKGCTSLMRNIM